jgi:hypothetical protein
MTEVEVILVGAAGYIGMMVTLIFAVLVLKPRR